MSAFWSRHVGAAAGCCLKALLSEWCVPFGGNAGAAAGYRCKVLLEGAAVRVLCAVWSGHAGPAAGWRCKEGAAVTVGCALWSRHAGGAARCCCQSGARALERADAGAAARCRLGVLPFEWCVRFQAGAAAG